ncbi:MAG: DUF4350 domain-containing protein [Deltaproteobacteria bacterium]|nr:DUF4350 domain-containing protein [Deltaproteobacteria bacterium]
MPRGRKWFGLAAGLLLASLATPRRALGGTDYDPRSAAWNGTRELVRIAAAAGVELEPVRELDWSRIQPGQGLLVLYPQQSLGLADLSAFLDEGGRVAWLDDYGASGAFLEWFQFRRDEDLHAALPRSPDLPELLIARPRSPHPLTLGVDALVTNVPVALSHPRLTPYYEFAGSGQGFLLVGQIGRGKLVVGGDPSVLINTMMRFPGNRRFGQNLLEFLASNPRGRVTMVWGDARARGAWRGRPRSRTPAREAVRTLNDLATSAETSLAAPRVLTPLAFLGLSLLGALVAYLTWGRRPSERYGPRGPEGTAAGLTERLGLFGVHGANMLFPSLVARRLLERRLLSAVNLRPPTDLRVVLDRLGPRLPLGSRAEVQALLMELDALRAGADEGSVQRVGTRQFLSLWRRIGAILPHLGGDG